MSEHIYLHSGYKFATDSGYTVLEEWRRFYEDTSRQLKLLSKYEQFFVRVTSDQGDQRFLYTFITEFTLNDNGEASSNSIDRFRFEEVASNDFFRSYTNPPWELAYTIKNE